MKLNNPVGKKYALPQPRPSKMETTYNWCLFHCFISGPERLQKYGISF